MNCEWPWIFRFFIYFHETRYIALMTGKAWFVLFLFALWCVFASWFYNCKVKGLCNDTFQKKENSISQDTSTNGSDNRTIEEQTENNQTTESDSKKDLKSDVSEKNVVTENSNENPFEVNSYTITESSAGSLLKNELFSDLKAGEKILITGKYFENESNSSNQENLGFARAESFKSLLIKRIGADKIEISSEAIEGDSTIVTLSDLISFKKIKPSEEKKLAKRDGKVIVYFDYTSDNPKLGDEVKAYLDQIAKELVTDRKKFIVATGYTDDVGKTKNNYYMGQHRAEAIRNYLRTKGANKFQVHVKSFGEYRPVAENNSEEGRAKNRRVEIKLNY